MEVEVKKGDDWVVTATTDICSGVFFRNPIYFEKFEVFGLYYGNTIDLENPPLIYRLLNLPSTFKKLIKWIQETDNAASFSLRSLRSPIYFKREVRTLEYDSPEVKIKSWGFNYVDEPVGGYCEKEITKMNVLGKKKTYRSDVNKGYKMTYIHVVLNDVIKKM